MTLTESMAMCWTNFGNILIADFYRIDCQNWTPAEKEMQKRLHFNVVMDRLKAEMFDQARELSNEKRRNVEQPLNIPKVKA